MKTNPNDQVKMLLENDYIEHGDVFRGLTKREYFAAMAMIGFVSNLGRSHVEWTTASLSKNARLTADALIEELNKEV